MPKTREDYDEYALSYDDCLDMIVEQDAIFEQISLERYLCIALIARMALSMGLPVGMAEDASEGEEYRSLCLIDLPSGQLCWHIPSSELHLFSELPPYTGVLDPQAEDTQTRQERMMNPGKLPYLGETVVRGEPYTICTPSPWSSPSFPFQGHP